MFGKQYVDERVHSKFELERFYPDGKTFYQKRDDGYNHCKYCGSFSPKDALKLLSQDTVDASGSDWKYGWPHKFYVSPGKFYSKHLYDADEKIFEELTNLLASKLGIRFIIDEKGLKYLSPYDGYQTWTNDLNNGAPKVPEGW